MPSHIFTRLGLWDESIQANLAAQQAAHQQGDTGEELHAMDYLVYAYLQSGRDNDAARVIQQLKSMPKLDQSDLKIAYAASAMPIRYAVERGHWAAAASVIPPSGAPPHVVAIALWARGLGLARGDRASAAQQEVAQLREIEQQLRASGDAYWASQTDILLRELEAWSDEAEHRPGEAVALMRTVADDEDTLEKLPVTPGPIIPAREQLGELLLEQNHADLAQKEFEAVLSDAPGGGVPCTGMQPHSAARNAVHTQSCRIGYSETNGIWAEPAFAADPDLSVNAISPFDFRVACEAMKSLQIARMTRLESRSQLTTTHTLADTARGACRVHRHTAEGQCPPTRSHRGGLYARSREPQKACQADIEMAPRTALSRRRTDPQASASFHEYDRRRDSCDEL